MAESIVSFAASATVKSGSYNKNDFKSRLIGTSDCNSSIPFYSVFFHNMITFTDSEVRVLEYSLPVISPIYGNITKYDALTTKLIVTERQVNFRFKKLNVVHNIGVHRGLIYDESGNVLMCLGINPEYLLNTPIAQIIENPDYSQFTMFIDKAFTNPIYDNIRKNLEKTYLLFCEEQGIDTVYTSKINSWLFKNNYKQPKFKNVTEMKKFLKQEVPKSLLID